MISGEIKDWCKHDGNTHILVKGDGVEKRDTVIVIIKESPKIKKNQKIWWQANICMIDGFKYTKVSASYGNEKSFNDRFR